MVREIMGIPGNGMKQRMVESMERLAKRCQIMGGWILLCNLAAVFLPYTRLIQENYKTLRWSQIDYLDGLLQGFLPSGTEQMSELTVAQITFIVCLMFLPILGTLFAGIYGIVGNSRQIISGILTYVITVLYLILAIRIPCLWPETVGGQQYERDCGCYLPMSFSLISAVLFTIGFVAASKVKKAGSAEIPKVMEMKQEQVVAKYSMVSNVESNPSIAVQPYIPGSIKGVLVGLSGVYAGAEIPMADGETIRFGRLSNNDLVFNNQPKVSRNHCQVRWDAAQKKFSFRDYSSNGSFANGSEECLPQNIDLWIEPGTVIAIGDNTNLFRLE